MLVLQLFILRRHEKKSAFVLFGNLQMKYLFLIVHSLQGATGDYLVLFFDGLFCIIPDRKEYILFKKIYNRCHFQQF